MFSVSHQYLIDLASFHVNELTIVILLAPYKGGDPAAGSPTATLLRLHPNHQSHYKHLPPLRVSPALSSATNFRDVTGGVYKARERIHRGLLIHDY